MSWLLDPTSTFNLFSKMESFFKTFSLTDCSLDNLLWNVFWMIRFLTVNIDIQTNFRASLIHYAFAVICFGCYLYSYLFCMVYNLGWVYPVTKDTTAAVIILSLGLASEIATMKLIYLFLLRKQLKIVIDKYRQADESVRSRSRYMNTALYNLRAVKMRMLIFWSSFNIGSFIYIMLPSVMPGHNLPENSLILYGLEPMSETPNYQLAYSSIILAGVMATAVPTNVTVLLIVLVGYIEAHILALAKEFQCLWKDSKSDVLISNETDRYIGTRQMHKEANTFVKERLMFLVSRHAELVILLQQIRMMFRGMLALEFILTMIALCAVMLGGLEETFLQIPYTIIQLVVDCLVGQRIIDAGMIFQRSVYECGWQNFNASNMNTIQIVLQCSQKGMSLTAGGITTLSFESFGKIIKSVYSAYATLRNSLKKD